MSLILMGKDTTFIEGREKTLKYKFNKKSILSISFLKYLKMLKY